VGSNPHPNINKTKTLKIWLVIYQLEETKFVKSRLVDFKEFTLSTQTGAAMGDLYGYSATFTGMEKLPAAFISGSTTTSALGGLTANYTVVYGTNS